MFLVPYALLPEIIDRDELKTGCRREGIYYGIFVFLQKVGISIGLAVGSILLGLVGYSGEVEAGNANFGILLVLRLLTGLFPSILFVLAVIPMFIYPFGKKGYERKSLTRNLENDDNSESGDYTPPDYKYLNQ